MDRHSFPIAPPPPPAPLPKTQASAHAPFAYVPLVRGVSLFSRPHPTRFACSKASVCLSQTPRRVVRTAAVKHEARCHKNAPMQHTLPHAPFVPPFAVYPCCFVPVSWPSRLSARHVRLQAH
ncbi:hypothetical protein TRVL_04438 [Trypanosoma vivax]|nr:hypothetical protein TRVL_04438 [Trypanosoma vivax]